MRQPLQAGALAAGLLAAVLPLPAAWAAPHPTLAVELRRSCPARRLDWLNPGILIDGIEAFRDGLTAARRARMERLAAPALEPCVAGASCVNAAYIGAARRMGLMPALVRSLCAMPYRCAAPFACAGD